MAYAHAERVFDALGDFDRRAVFLRLKGRARSVGELAEGLDVTRSAVSQHRNVGDWGRVLAMFAAVAERES